MIWLECEQRGVTRTKQAVVSQCDTSWQKFQTLNPLFLFLDSKLLSPWMERLRSGSADPTITPLHNQFSNGFHLQRLSLQINQEIKKRSEPK